MARHSAVSDSHGPPTWNTPGLDGEVAPAGQHVADLDLAGAAQDDAERAGVGVVEDVDDGAGEGGVGQRRHRDQQAARADVVQPPDGQRRDRQGRAADRSRAAQAARTRDRGRRAPASSAPVCPTAGRAGRVVAPARGRVRSHRRAGSTAADRPGGDRADAPGPPRVTGVTQAETSASGHLLLRGDFRRLLGTRLLAQFGDGVFQAALAGTVLFNPQRAADPVAVAAGLRRSCCCPTRSSAPSPASGWTAGAAGRCCCAPTCCAPAWWRSWRRWCSAASQGTAFYAAGLAVFSVNRFVLAALSAGAPAHHRRRLAGLGQRAVDDVRARSPPSSGGGARHRACCSSPAPATAATRRWRCRRRCPIWPPRRWSPASPAATSGPTRRPLGPAVGAGRSGAGMVAGARHVWALPPAAAALLAISLHRLVVRRPDADDPAALPEHVRRRAAACSPAGSWGWARWSPPAPWAPCWPRRITPGVVRADRQAAVDHAAAGRRGGDAGRPGPAVRRAAIVLAEPGPRASSRRA